MPKLNFSLQNIIILILVGIVLYLFIFDKDPNPSAALEAERTLLLEQKELLQIEIDELKIEVIDLKSRDKIWLEKDSLKDIEISKANAENEIQKQKSIKAQNERKKAQKILEEFRKDPPIEDDPVDLIIITKKRIDNE